MQQFAGYVLVILTSLIAIELTIAYHRQTRGTWRDTVMGKHLMTFMAAIAAVVATWAIAVVIRILGHETPGWFEWLRLAVFSSIPAVLLWRRILLAHAQGQPTETKETS